MIQLTVDQQRALEWASDRNGPGYGAEAGVAESDTAVLVAEGLVVQSDIGTISEVFVYLSTDKGEDLLRKIPRSQACRFQEHERCHGSNTLGTKRCECSCHRSGT